MDMESGVSRHIDTYDEWCLGSPSARHVLEALAIHNSRSPQGGVEAIQGWIPVPQHWYFFSMLSHDMEPWFIILRPVMTARVQPIYNQDRPGDKTSIAEHSVVVVQEKKLFLNEMVSLCWSSSGIQVLGLSCTVLHFCFTVSSIFSPCSCRSASYHMALEVVTFSLMDRRQNCSTSLFRE